MTASTRCVQFRECGELLYGGIQIVQAVEQEEDVVGHSRRV